MANLLKSIKGRFIITLNDCEGVREIFKDFLIVPVSLACTVRGGAGKEVGEVIIMDGKETIENLPLI